MKRLRLICALLTLGMLLLLPSKAAAQACCNEFRAFCQGLCWTHGGMFWTDCNVGMDEADVCLCNDDPGNPIFWEPTEFCAN